MPMWSFLIWRLVKIVTHIILQPCSLVRNIIPELQIIGSWTERLKLWYVVYQVEHRW